MMWVLLGLSLLGLGAVAVAMPKHQKDVLQRPLSNIISQLLKVLGWSLLALAAGLAIVFMGPTLGLSAWLMAISFAAVGLVLQITYRPKWLRIITPVVAVGLVMAGLF